MTKNHTTPEELKDTDLDQVQGGLVAHERTHVSRQGPRGKTSGFFDEADALKPKSSPSHIRAGKGK